jgi:hypothetical protein
MILDANGTLQGTPVTPGTYTFTVRATDANGCSGVREYTIIVSCPVITLNPAAGALPGAVVNTPYSQSFTATGGIGPYTFTKSGGTLPPRMILDANGTLQGTPVTPGTYTFTVRATDANGCSGVREYTIIVSCPVITLNPAALPGAVVNTPYSQSFTATGGIGPYTFTKSGGTPPPGMILNSAGMLQGTPVTPGTYTFTVTATDANGCTGVAQYQLIISCPVGAPNPVGAILSSGTSGIIISEFRFDGPNGANDEFVELVNNNSMPKTIVSTDAPLFTGFSVWGIVAGQPAKVCTIPNGTVLNPGQHYLCARTTGPGAYELGNYATPDFNTATTPGPSATNGLDVDGGIALFSSEDVQINNDGSVFSALGTVFREDAVGFRKKNSDTFPPSFAGAFREGDGLFPIGNQDCVSRQFQNPSDCREYSYVRKHGILGSTWSGTVYNDTCPGPGACPANSNTTDFALVSNTGDYQNVSFANLDRPTGPSPDNAPTVAPGLAGSPFDPSSPGLPGCEVATVPVFGAPGPQGRANPTERNYSSQFIRSLFDTGSGGSVTPNTERSSGIVCGGSRGDLVLRITYKNQTTVAQGNLRVRWIDLSTINRGNANFTSIIDLLDSTAPGGLRRVFIRNGRDLNALATGSGAAAVAAHNDPAAAPGDGSGGNPSGDGIVNGRAAGGPGVKTARGTYVEGVNKTPTVSYPNPNPQPLFGPGQLFSQLNPTYDATSLFPLLDPNTQGPSPCRVGGFNSATVSTPPTSPGSPGTTTTALPAVLPVNGSISLEHRFGVIRQGSFLIVGIIESN